ncbi:MAG: hypothetical protein ABIW76_19335, partial [Fibrobacteria bacterium]
MIRPGPFRRIRVQGLIALALTLSLTGPGSAAVPLKSHLTHYGPWKDLDIPMFRRFSMVTLQPGMYSGSS